MIDVLATALANRERRRLLTTLLEHDPDATLPIAAVTADDRDTTIALVHAHLPMLDAADIVRWGRDSQRVRRGPRFEECAMLLKRFHEHPC